MGFKILLTNVQLRYVVLHCLSIKNDHLYVHEKHRNNTSKSIGFTGYSNKRHNIENHIFGIKKNWINLLKIIKILGMS